MAKLLDVTAARASAGARRAYVGGMLAFTARGIAAASATDQAVREEVRALPDGFTFRLRVLPAGPSMCLCKRGDLLAVAEGAERPALSIDIKHLRHAVSLFLFTESTPRAIANNRMVIDGDVASAMRMNRILARVMAILLPPAVALRATEQRPEGTAAERGRALARLLWTMARGEPTEAP